MFEKSDVVGLPHRTTVLDDGYIELVDVMPAFNYRKQDITDQEQAVLQAARTSTGKVGTSFDSDYQLLRYLLSHRHTTPFEMVELKFKFRVPMDTWRQIIRHRTACLAGSTQIRPVKDYVSRITLDPVSLSELYDRYTQEGNLFNLLVWGLNAGGLLQPVRVKAIVHSGTKRTYRLTLVDGQSIKASAEHKFYVEGKVGPEFLPLGEIFHLPEVGRATSVQFVGGFQRRFMTLKLDTLLPWLSEVASLEVCSEEPVYDLEVYNAGHVFLADDIFVHNSVNEYSTRYVEPIDSCYIPGELRLQATNNFQGSDGVLSDWPESAQLMADGVAVHPNLVRDGDFVSYWPSSTFDGRYTSVEGLRYYNPNQLTPHELFSKAALYRQVGSYHLEVKSISEKPIETITRLRKTGIESARVLYDIQASLGVAKELARSVIPISNYTEAVWKCDLHNILHFLGLRMEGHAQWEVRQFAEAMGAYVQLLVPNIWNIWMDVRFNSMSLSHSEVCIIQDVLKRKDVSRNDMPKYGWLSIPSTRAWREMVDRMSKVLPSELLCHLIR